MAKIMLKDLVIPNLGEAQSTEIIEVNISEGQQVRANDPLIVLESEKAAMEIPSNHSGKIHEVLLKEGEIVSEGAIFARIEVDEPDQILEKNEKNTNQTTDDEAAKTDEKFFNKSFSLSGINAGPAVRKYARELEINLSNIPGTGKNNQITKQDLIHFIHNNKTNEFNFASYKSEDFNDFKEAEIISLSKIQKIGAENLHKSWISIPHVTHFEEVVISEIDNARKINGLTPLSIIAECFIKTVSEFPIFNSSLLDNDNVIIKKEINLGIAVDTELGLVVPVIKNANRMKAKELMEEIASLAEKAKNKKLLSKDMTNGTVTISSLGKIGGTGFTPIINPPEVCILGISRAKKEVFLGENNDLIEREILPIALSYDHRLINGADAGRFMARLKEVIQSFK